MSYLDDFFNLKDKTVVLTGGGGVLAGAIGTGYAKAGCNVVFLDINEEAAKSAAEKIREKGYKAIGVKSDVLNTESLENALKTILSEFKTVDILINAAGGNVHGATIPPEKTIFDVSLKDLDKVTDLNFKGTVIPSLVFGKEMAKNKRGVMINISSMAALQSITRVVGYSAAKAAVSNFTQWMAMELAMKFGEFMRVNAIAPGFFIGEQNRRLLTNEDGSYTERGNQVIRKTPMNRFGEAHELIGACLYLSSNAASFVTGVVLPVDGGFSIYSGV
jgi:NAD(P)-dependent dehydrogenase (short-subunit alcohol dehydrogenase family)